MSCENMNERLESFALGILDEKEKQEVSVHVQKCDHCRKRLASLRQSTQLLENTFNEEPPEWLLQKTMALVKSKPKRTSFLWSGWGFPALAAAAVVIVVLFIKPGIIQKQKATSGVAVLEQKKKANTGYPGSIPVTANYVSQGVSIDISGELNINLENPAYDRSIYEKLGVRKEVAKLLL